MRERTHIILRKVLRSYFKLALRVFFRRIEIEGQENVPPTAPLILAANHLNSFIDPLVMQRAFPRELTITAMNTLASKPLYGTLMKIFGVVPFHRKRDWGKGADRLGNAETAAECKRRLALGEALCIFPEGTSHSDPTLRPFQPGTAWIALEYTASEVLPRPLAILPAGQIYQTKRQLRPHVLVRFGEPIDIGHWRQENPAGGRRELTTEMESRVKALIPDFRRRRDPLLLDWAAELLTTGNDFAPLVLRSPTLSDRCRLMRQIQSGLTQWESTQPEAHRALIRRLQFHRSALRRWGLSSPCDLYLHHSLWCVARFAFRELAFALAGLPIVAWGGLNHALLYLTLHRIAQRGTTKRNLRASHAFYFSLIVLPLYYTLQIAASWIFFPTAFAACYTFLLPLTGYGAVLCWERMASAWRQVRVLAHLISDPPMRSRLRTENDCLRIELLRCCRAVRPEGI
jgi:glycerol-3-phosphate O-acyltransferase/dihydroxyacetone phosphate acyltransferase